MAIKETFIREAQKYNVFPPDASVAARVIAPRPNITAGRSEFVYTRPMIGLPRGRRHGYVEVEDLRPAFLPRYAAEWRLGRDRQPRRAGRGVRLLLLLPARGERVELVFTRSHCAGAVCRDARHIVTPELSRRPARVWCARTGNSSSRCWSTSGRASG
jgi:hypothetical protein